MKLQKEAFDFYAPITYERMMTCLDRLAEQYSFIGLTNLGESVLGKSSPLVTLGQGEKAVLYVGAHSGTEWMTTAFLLRYLVESAEYYQNGGQAFQYSLPYLFSTRRLYIVPMLNPDGIEYVMNGIAKDHILYGRVHAMNGGSEDFSDWKGNARGVELSRNYSYGFADYKRLEANMGILGGCKSGFSGEMSESEPETLALCTFLRYHQDIRAVLSLHLGGEKIIHTAGNKTAPRSASIGRVLSRLTGYPLTPYDGWESVGRMSAWCIDEWNIPAFSVICGEAGKHTPDVFRTYANLREMLFTMPTMI